jgi:hypothetical protein
MRFLFLISVCISFHLYRAQNSGWAWMKGDTIMNQPGVYGTQLVPSALNKPPYTYEGLEWKDVSGNFWLYDNEDLWKFNPSTLQWTWMRGTQGVQAAPCGIKGVASPTNSPGTRGYGTFTWVDNANNFWLYGGGGSMGTRSDLWKYTISSNEWIWLKGDTTYFQNGIFGVKGVASSSNNPPALAESNAAWTDSNNNLWLFGGDGPMGIFNTLWKYSISTNEWTWMSGDSVANMNSSYGIKGISAPTNKPSSRWCYTKWIDNNSLWLFGGSRYDGPTLNDLWKYDLGTNEWTWVSGTDTINDPGLYKSKCVSSVDRIPSGRVETRGCWKDLNGNFWLFGGGSYYNMNDLWVYSPSVNKWTWVHGDSLNGGSALYGTLQQTTPNNNPGGRMGSMTWIDGFNNLWLFGGNNPGGYMNDLWKFTLDQDCMGEVPIPMGIKEVDHTKKFSIYPVPFTDKFTVELKLSNASPVKLLIRNLQGQVLYNTEDKTSAKHHQIEVDLSGLNLQQGIYVLDVYDGSSMVTRKVWKK